MSLSSDLVSQFVKITKDEDKTKKETTVYGTARVRDGATYVQIDGSELLTPVAEAAGANDGERVTVLIKNHKAILNGNLDSPAARTGDVQDLENKSLTIESADIKYANIDFSNIGKAAMEYLYSQSGLIKNVVVGDQTITGTLAGVTIIGDLIEGNTIKADKLVIKGEDGLFYKLNTDGLSVINEGNVFSKDICSPEENVTNVEWHDDYSATVTTNGANELLAIYFWIDPEKTYIFSYEGETCEVAMYSPDWVEVFRSADNVVKDVIITGAHHCYFSPHNDTDLTTYAFKNVRLIEKDVYDKNKLDGSIIMAKSITATKISVSDLVAFDATIGGFNITDNSIYSGVKESIDNTTRGVYMDNDGQFAVGDANNYLKYYRDADGSYKLSISSKSLVNIGGRNLYQGTRNFDGDKWLGMEHWETWEGDYLGFKEYGRSGAWLGLHQAVDVIEGETYTFSFYLSGNSDAYVTVYTDWDHVATTPANVDIGSVTEDRKRYSVTFTANITGMIAPRVENHNDNGWIQICGLKFERGNQATDWSPAPEDAESGIDSAAKTATNFMSFDSDGLQIGDKTTGAWSGFRTQITSAAFNILNAAGATLASYGEKLIELGKNATDAVIRLCGGKGTIEYDGEDMYLQMTSDNIRLKGTEMASLYSQATTNGTSKLGAVHAGLAEVQVVAGSGSSSSNLYVKPTQILLYSDDIRVDGTMTDVNTNGKFISVLTGNSGIWTYRKYSNGDVELWGTYWITDQPCTTALGGMYRTPAIAPDEFPFAVYDANLTASYETEGYGAMLWATTNTTNYYPPNYYLLRPVSGTITLGQINFHVHGRWK